MHTVSSALANKLGMLMMHAALAASLPFTHTACSRSLHCCDVACCCCADTISELKLGNGTSVLIFANISSSLPTSVGALLAQNTESDPGNIAIYATAFFLTTLGIIYVQEAERRIPVNYSSR